MKLLTVKTSPWLGAFTMTMIGRPSVATSGAALGASGEIANGTLTSFTNGTCAMEVFGICCPPLSKMPLAGGVPTAPAVTPKSSTQVKLG